MRKTWRKIWSQNILEVKVREKKMNLKFKEKEQKNKEFEWC